MYIQKNLDNVIVLSTPEVFTLCSDYDYSDH